MASNFFETIITRQIETFVKTFVEDSSNLFKNEQNNLIHPGEYGMYKERCLRTLLQSILTRNYNISDGFIITSCDNHISTQCDLLIYNAATMPLTDNGVGNFFPIEDIYGIIEVKSTLNKTDFKTALQKLANNKKLSDDRNKMLALNADCRPHFYEIPTFLVCNKLNFNFDKIDFENDIYAGYDRNYWHNAILSLEDGLFLYNLDFPNLPFRTRNNYKQIGYDVDNDSCAFQYSYHATIFRDGIETINCSDYHIAVNPEKKYQHIIEFLSIIKQTVDSTVKYEFDSMVYLGINLDRTD